MPKNNDATTKSFTSIKAIILDLVNNIGSHDEI